jgi:type II secretory pathway component PulM
MAVVDKLREKWDAITPRERKIVVFGGISLIVIVALWLGMSIRTKLAGLEHRNEQMQKALDVLQDLRASGGQKASADDIVSTIPNEPVPLETYLSNSAEAVKLTVPSFNPRTPVEKNGFRTSVMQIELRDLTIEQIKDYLERVETGNRLVQVTSLTFNRNFRDKDKLDVKLDISTYSKVAEQPAGSGSGSGSGSASGTGGG